MLILFQSFLRILLLEARTPAFSSTILLHKFMQVFDTLKIPVHCFGTRDTLKKVIYLILSYALFLLLCHSHMNLNIKLMTSLIINLSLAVFYRQSLPWEGLNKPRGDPDSSSSCHFSPCPPQPVSSASEPPALFLRERLSQLNSQWQDQSNSKIYECHSHH